MVAAKDKAEMEQALARVIRKGINTQANRRLLTRMPVFAAEQDLPDRMRHLLERLDEAEAFGNMSDPRLRGAGS